MKLLVTGDRNWCNVEVVVEVLSKFPPKTILVHGACRGADNMCAAVAEQLGFIIRPYPADWARYPRAAGPIRNQQMLDSENHPKEPIDLCLAFHDDLASSKGTKDMVTRAKKVSIKVRLTSSDGATRTLM